MTALPIVILLFFENKHTHTNTHTFKHTHKHIHPHNLSLPHTHTHTHTHTCIISCSMTWTVFCSLLLFVAKWHYVLFCSLRFVRCVFSQRTKKMTQYFWSCGMTLCVTWLSRTWGLWSKFIFWEGVGRQEACLRIRLHVTRLFFEKFLINK